VPKQKRRANQRRNEASGSHRAGIERSTPRRFAPLRASSMRRLRNLPVAPARSRRSAISLVASLPSGPARARPSLTGVRRPSPSAMRCHILDDALSAAQAAPSRSGALAPNPLADFAPCSCGPPTKTSSKPYLMSAVRPPVGSRAGLLRAPIRALSCQRRTSALPCCCPRLRPASARFPADDTNQRFDPALDCAYSQHLCPFDVP